MRNKAVQPESRRPRGGAGAVLRVMALAAVLALAGQFGAAGQTRPNRAPSFADTMAGNSTIGSTAYPGGGMRRVAGLNTNAGELVLVSAAVDPMGGYAYFGTNTSPGVVVKVRLSDFTRVGALTLNPGENGLFSAAIDPAGGYAFFGTFDFSGSPTTPGKVVKVRLSDFTRVGALTLNDGEPGIGSMVVDTAAGYAYCGTRLTVGTTPGKVVKVRLGTGNALPTREGALTLNSGETYLISAAIDTAGGYAYFGTNGSPGIVIKVRLADLTRVGAVTLYPGENGIDSAVIDPGGGYGYFTTHDNSVFNLQPGKVVKVRLSDFARMGALLLNGMENNINCAAIDPVGGYAYFGVTADHQFSAAKVVKVRLSDFSRAGTLTLNNGENALYRAAYDPAGGVVYFAASYYKGVVPALSNGEAIKVALSPKSAIQASRITVAEAGAIRDLRFYSHAAAGNLRLALYDNASPRKLLWQSGSLANTAAGAWLTVPLSLGSPAALGLQPGTYWMAWQTDSAADVPSYTAGTEGDGFTVEQPYGAFPATLENSGTVVPNSDLWSEYLTTARNAARVWWQYR